VSRSRPLLLLTVLASSTALAGFAHAEAAGDPAYPEVGGWGQAWGDEAAPAASSSVPPRRAPVVAPGYVPPPSAAALPSALPPALPRGGGSVQPAVSAAAAPPPTADDGAYSEGGWGQAWGDEEAAPSLRPRSAATSTLSDPAPPSPAGTAAPAGPRQTVPRQAASSRRSAPTPMAEDVADNTAGPMRSIVPRGVGSMEVRALPSDVDDDGDAVGLKKPPRIVPKALMKEQTRREGEDPPVRMVADQFIYDREYSIVTAKGKVEMVQSGRTISADTVTYNLKQDVMGASGNVVLTEPSGEVTFADYFELTGDFKSGVAKNIRMILADNSRLAALTGQRVGGDRTDLDLGVYTACEPCRDDPDATPIWQAKAARITHNQAEAQIEYRDAWIELAGIPVLYTPYLSHPDPTVKRKSGFLAPTVGYGSTLGPSVTTPYFFVMSDQEDFTLTPRFMMPSAASSVSSSETYDQLAVDGMKHLLLQGEHRWRGINGEAKTTGSFTANPATGDIRGNIESKGIVDLDRVWRAGWQVQNQSDNTYRQVYRIRTDNDRPWLLTRPYVEGFGRSNYAMAEVLSFQGPHLLDDTSKSPVVLPHIVTQNISNPGWAGGYWTVDNDIMAYSRSQGTDAQRLSSRTAWNLPVTSPDGQVFLFSASARGDGYRAQHLDTVPSGDSSIGRAIPEASLTWRYPFVRPGSLMSQVIEPVAMVATSPVGGNSVKIPNEDSLAFELDETNVMRPNRLVGLDRVEGGTRGGYGLRWSGYPARGGMVGLQVAQGWRQHVDSTFGDGSGFTSSFSDYLGRVDIQPRSMVTLTDRVRLDKTTLQVQRNEATASIGPPSFSLSTSYELLASTSSAGFSLYPRRQYVAYALNSNFSEYWRLNLALNQDLTKEGGLLGWTSSAVYDDECFALMTSMNRVFSDNPGILSGYTMMFTVVLKSLGEAPLSAF